MKNTLAINGVKHNFEEVEIKHPMFTPNPKLIKKYYFDVSFMTECGTRIFLKVGMLEDKEAVLSDLTNLLRFGIDNFKHEGVNYSFKEVLSIKFGEFLLEKKEAGK